MNHVEMFKRFQRLQGGEYDVRGKEAPFAQNGQWWWEKAAQDDEQGHTLTAAERVRLTPTEEAQEELDWQKNIKELLTITPDLTPEERKQVTDLNPKDWDDSTREKIGAASENSGKDTQLAGGTEDVSPYELAGAWGTRFLPTDASSWRSSGAAKGPGYLGPLRRPDGQTSTELSVGVDTGDRESEIPSLVPSLSQDEIDHLLAGGKPTKSIIDKAIAHARLRTDAGRDPFYEYGENPSPLRYARGTSSVGHQIFKRAQHLAGGTSDLPYDPSYPGPTNPHESGSGYWTSRLVGTGVGTASNFFVPGLGLLTGPIASWAMRAMQSGMSQNAVQNAVKAYQTSQTGGGQSGDTTTTPAADNGSNATAPATNAPPSAGIGIDPFGNPADPGEFWSNDFGRWGEGDQYGTTPGNYNPPGPGGGIGTRGVWGGQTTIPIASDPNFTPSLGWAAPAASGGGAYGGNTMAKIALHSGTFRDAATPEQWAFMQNYLSGGGGGGGGGQGVGGAGRPMTQSQQMGTSSVNPGLKLFHAIQKRKKVK